jgi:hypothetical protein
MIESDIRNILASYERRLRKLESDPNLHSSRHDPKRWRRQRLRFARRNFYAGMSRAAAAQAIAIDWAAFANSPQNAPAQPGTLHALFAELTEAGCRPLAARTIFDDLDVELYPD